MITLPFCIVLRFSLIPIGASTVSLITAIRIIARCSPRSPIHTLDRSQPKALTSLVLSWKCIVRELFEFILIGIHFLRIFASSYGNKRKCRFNKSFIFPRTDNKVNKLKSLLTKRNYDSILCDPCLDLLKTCTMIDWSKWISVSLLSKVSSR